MVYYRIFFNWKITFKLEDNCFTMCVGLCCRTMWIGYKYVYIYMGSPCGSAGKESTCSSGDLGLIPGLGRSPGEGKGYQLQYSGLENFMDCIVLRVAKSQTQLSDFHFYTFISLFIYIYIKYIYVYVSPPSWASFPPTLMPPLLVVTEHWAEPLCYTATPTSYFIHGRIYMSMLLWL